MVENMFDTIAEKKFLLKELVKKDYLTQEELILKKT